MEIKTCKYCDSEISVNAQICPFCRSAQNKKIQFKGIGVVMLIFAIPIGLIQVASCFNGKKVERLPAPVFSQHQSELVVKNSELFFRECDQCKGMSTAVVTGMISNSGSTSWKNIQLEVRFFDVNGKMIDSITDSGFSNAILPNGEVSFRVMEPAAKNKEEYASHKVFINSAKAEVIY